MCGRFYIPEPDDDLDFKVIMDRISKNLAACGEMKLGEICPTDIVPVLTNKAPVLMKWGFSRFDGKGQIINARLETACQKPMFKRAYDFHRCLVPAGYYYEWLKDGALKQKYAIGTGAPIYMAGLYKFEKDASLPSFVILTRPAAPNISFIHDRMPVIIPEDVRSKWLSEPIHTGQLFEISEECMTYKEAI